MESAGDQLEVEERSSQPPPNLPELGYQELPLLPRERRLLKRLAEQHAEGVLWSRFFLRLIPSLGFFGLYIVLVGFMFDWYSVPMMLVVGIVIGVLATNFAYQRVTRRNWPTIDKLINWEHVERLRARDAERRK